MNLSDIDKFMQEEMMPFYLRTFDAFKQNHHAFYSIINSVMCGKKIRIGMQVTESKCVMGEYTVHLDGGNISHLESGVLSPEIETPFGIVRPYVILEKSTVEKMIQDEANFIKDPFRTKIKYYRDVTIKFL